MQSSDILDGLRIQAIDCRQVVEKMAGLQMLGVNVDIIENRYLYFNFSVEDVFVIMDIHKKSVIAMGSTCTLKIGFHKRPKDIIIGPDRLLIGYDYLQDKLSFITLRGCIKFQYNVKRSFRREDLNISIVPNSSIVVLAATTSKSLIIKVLSLRTNKLLRAVTFAVPQQALANPNDSLLKLHLVHYTRSYLVYIVKAISGFRLSETFFYKYTLQSNKIDQLEAPEELNGPIQLQPSINYGPFFWTSRLALYTTDQGETGIWRIQGGSICKVDTGHVSHIHMTAHGMLMADDDAGFVVVRQRVVCGRLNVEASLWRVDGVCVASVCQEKIVYSGEIVWRGERDGEKEKEEGEIDGEEIQKEMKDERVHEIEVIQEKMIEEEDDEEIDRLGGEGLGSVWSYSQNSRTTFCWMNNGIVLKLSKSIF